MFEYYSEHFYLAKICLVNFDKSIWGRIWTQQCYIGLRTVLFGVLLSSLRLHVIVGVALQNAVLSKRCLLEANPWRNLCSILRRRRRYKNCRQFFYDDDCDDYNEDDDDDDDDSYDDGGNDSSKDDEDNDDNDCDNDDDDVSATMSRSFN